MGIPGGNHLNYLLLAAFLFDYGSIVIKNYKIEMLNKYIFLVNINLIISSLAEEDFQ